MKCVLQIFIDRLRDGHTETIDERLPSGLLEIREPDLVFDREVEVQGEAYLAQDELILRLNVQSECQIPCLVCNEAVSVPIKIENAYHAEPLQEVKGAVLDLKEILREMILLEIPPYVECCPGNCPKRPQIAPFMKPVEEAAKEEEEGNRPFSRLRIKGSEIVEEP